MQRSTFPPGPGGAPDWPTIGPFSGASQGWLRDQLLERRAIFVPGYLDHALALRASAELMTLDATGPDPIDVYLDCPDGTLEAAFVLIDTLDLLQAPSHVHALGEVGGPVVGVLAAGRERSIAPHARIRLGEPVVEISGNTSQVLGRSEQVQRLRDRFHERLAQATRRPIDEIANDLRRGRYLDAREALDYGLIDRIADRKA
jgi:ATP-dependent Clp protease, protease subunit